MSTTNRLFELRTYTAHEGRLNDLLARFEHHTLRLFKSHGMQVEGFWIPLENPEQKLIYLLSYSSLEAREEAWENFQNDPVWIEMQVTRTVTFWQRKNRFICSQPISLQ
jgi:hypothetical protein